MSVKRFDTMTEAAKVVLICEDTFILHMEYNAIAGTFQITPTNIN
jgi:hypothetical protein